MLIYLFYLWWQFLHRYGTFRLPQFWRLIISWGSFLDDRLVNYYHGSIWNGIYVVFVVCSRRIHRAFRILTWHVNLHPRKSPSPLRGLMEPFGKFYFWDFFRIILYLWFRMKRKFDALISEIGFSVWHIAVVIISPD